jgi:hypothetical protein
MSNKEDNNKGQTQENEIISYEKDKIELLLNVLNQVQFQGIQQAQAIAQVSVILSNPVQNNIKKEDAV